MCGLPRYDECDEDQHRKSNVNYGAVGRASFFRCRYDGVIAAPRPHTTIDVVVWVLIGAARFASGPSRPTYQEKGKPFLLGSRPPSSAAVADVGVQSVRCLVT